MTTAPPRPSPPDQAARDRIARALDETLFVEAGAGSGKTTALVGRVVALVAAGVELRNVAAITFTEKAGAELRDRVRQELERRADEAADPDERARYDLALGQLDGAAIGTLHSFAQRILSEHPVEAGLPPRIEVLDEVSSGVQFDRRWSRTLDQLLGDPGLQRTLLLLRAADVRPARLRALAQAFDAQWDLVEERVPAHVDEPPSVTSVLGPARALVDDLLRCCDDCKDHEDGLVRRIHEFADLLDAVEGCDDDLDAMELLTSDDKAVRPSGRVTRTGSKARWRCDIDEVRAKVVALDEELERACGEVLQACAHRIGAAVRDHTLRTATERQQAGRLEFHDLLVLARKLLRHPEHGAVVRAALHRRYARLLLDEFQDTDPIQIELAVRIAASDPATADAPDWADIDVAPGRLFVVGDPKQSIYRFRRADIATFLAAKRRFAPGAGAVELTTNFRTVAPVIDWVNPTFDHLMGMQPDVVVPSGSQPEYVGLDAHRGAPPEGPAVARLGSEPHPKGTSADDLRAAEARDVAHAISVIRRDRWQVHERDGDQERWRDARLGDITILVPARTSLPHLEDALEAAGIPFRTESSSLVYASRAVRDLLMVLRAADDPTDELRIVSALRTPLLGCGDDDLFRHRVEEGRGWAYNTPTPPDPAAGIVSAGLAYLRELHEARHWQSPSELLDRIARDRRALELAFAEGRPRDVWRRLRFVIDQARAWSEATGGSLRAYLHWVDQQTTEGARVTESILPETDDDAVRIMTIHAAKGLEFPITIVSGMSTKPGGFPSTVEVVFPRDEGGVGYKMGKAVVTDEWEAFKPIDEQMGYDERIRLLYVACTRAQDHLVVSLHRAADDRGKELRLHTNAELLVLGMGERAEELPDLGGELAPVGSEAAAAPSPPPPHDAWRRARDAALAAAARPRAVAATALTDEGQPDVAVDALEPAAADEQEGAEAPVQGSLFDQAPAPPGDDDPTDGLQKRPRDLDLPPWLKGRYGSAIGRAVHGVLQTIDLATGAGLDAAVAAQCQAEAVPDQEQQVRRLVTDALGSPSVQAAAGAAHWREVYACAPVAGRLLEGYVDLLYRAPDGLVVVDHKTSASADPAELDRRVESYRLQGAAYALAVGQATGEPVVQVVFVFLTPEGAIERPLPELAAAMADVERLVEAGDEVLAP